MASTSALLHADQALAMASLASLSAPLLGIGQAVSASQYLCNAQRLVDQLLRGDVNERGMFATARHSDGSDRTDGYGRTDWQATGLIGGIRLPVEGMAASWGLALSRDKQRLGAGELDRSDRWQTQATAWWQHQGQRVQTSVLGSISQSEVRNQRQVRAGTLTEQLHSQRQDHSAQLRVDAGWRLAPAMQPYLAAGVLHLRQGRFDEASDTGLGLAADRQSRTLPFIEAGLRLQWQGERVRLGGTLSWQRLTGNRGLDYQAHFDGLDLASFRVQGPSMPGDRLRMGVNAHWQLSPTLWLHGELSSESASGKYRNDTARLGLDWRF